MHFALNDTRAAAEGLADALQAVATTALLLSDRVRANHVSLRDERASAVRAVLFVLCVVLGCVLWAAVVLGVRLAQTCGTACADGSRPRVKRLESVPESDCSDSEELRSPRGDLPSTFPAHP